MNKEPRTGFIKDGGTRGRNCHLCAHMKGSVCTDKVMIEFSKQPRNKKGDPYVDRDDVCDYFYSKSKESK